MKKEVRITMEGIQAGANDTIITQSDGVYYYRNGKHVIRYEEAAGDGNDRMKNTLKLSPGQITLKKEGRDASSQMVFDLMEMTRTEYPTPYGSLSLQIITSEIVVTEEEDEILSVIRYSLSDTGGRLSENEVRIKIVSMKQ
jgi:uncharacterized beta-barrel protein YwiB (DUF1934 family)